MAGQRIEGKSLDTPGVDCTGGFERWSRDCENPETMEDSIEDKEGRAEGRKEEEESKPKRFASVGTMGVHLVGHCRRVRSVRTQ